MKTARRNPGARRLQVLDDPRQDSYVPRRKPAGAARCPGCGALWRRGRWSWSPGVQAPTGPRCPACLRIRDRVAAGHIILNGAFLAAHRDEILATVRACEAAERATHPMQRIIAIEGRGDEARVTTTDVHLARRIGHALRRAFKGALALRFGKGENLVRVAWRR